MKKCGNLLGKMRNLSEIEHFLVFVFLPNFTFKIHNFVKVNREKSSAGIALSLSPV